MPNLPLQAAPVVATVMGGAAVTATLAVGKVVQLTLDNGKTFIDVVVLGNSVVDTLRQNTKTAKREQKHCENWEDILDKYNSKNKDIQEASKL